MDIYQPTGDELREVGQIVDFSQYELDPTKEWEPMQYAFSIGGVGLAPLGDIQVVKAPQKNGKTFLLTLMMGALLKGEYIGMVSNIDNPTLLYIDTEQHPRDTLEVYRRVCMIGGIDGHTLHSQVRFLHMRGAQVEEIRHAILQYIVFYKPNVVFVDGLVDCVIDPNDQAESKSYISQLSAIAMRHNCAIWTVLHVNPGSDKMRGHLGTILSQKVSDVLMCKKERMPDGSVVFSVEQTDTRHKDVPKFQFAIEDRMDAGKPLAMPVALYVSDAHKQELDHIMRDCLMNNPLRSGELNAKVQEVAKVKKSKAWELMNEASTCGIIAKDSITSVYTYFGIQKTLTSDEVPF